jgi:hypothetical protein
MISSARARAAADGGSIRNDFPPLVDQNRIPSGGFTVSKTGHSGSLWESADPNRPPAKERRSASDVMRISCRSLTPGAKNNRWRRLERLLYGIWLKSD